MMTDSAMKFLLSVCAPLYKSNHVLKLALESLASQQYVSVEIIFGGDNL